MVRRSIGRYAAGLLAFVVLLSGCGSTGTKPAQTGGAQPAPSQPAPPAPKEPVKLTFWHTMNTEESATLNEIVKDFEAKNPDIKVSVEQTPFDGAQTKFKTAAQAGNAPDVFRAEIAWTPEFAALGFLLPVDKYLTDADKADYLKAPFAYNVYQGKTWGVPQVTDALALLYNKRLLKAAGVDVPKTMDEFVAAAKKLTTADGKQYGFVLRGDSYWYQPFMWAFGGGLIDEQKNVFINTPGAIEGLKFMISLRDQHKVVPRDIDFANDYTNMMTGFKEGKYAMILNGPWATSDILSGKEFQDRSNFGVAPIPRGPKGQGSPVGGHNYVIFAGTKNPDAAWKFVSFLNARENQVKFAVKNNLLPTRKSAYEDPQVKGNEILQGFLAQMQVATNRPVIPEGGQIYTAFTPEIQAALTGKKTPEAALAAVEKAWKELLKK